MRLRQHARKRTKRKALIKVLGKTKAIEVVTEVGEEAEPERRAQVLRVVAPGTAAQHALVHHQASRLLRHCRLADRWACPVRRRFVTIIVNPHGTRDRDEIERTVGVVKVKHGPDYRHMVAFYNSRVRPALALEGQGEKVESRK